LQGYKKQCPRTSCALAEGGARQDIKHNFQAKINQKACAATRKERAENTSKKMKKSTRY
jgi:hypothetical protein